jgi:solute:Na+ symporter, SSS family
MTVMFWPVVIFMAISLAIGLYTYTQVRGSSKRFTVCGKSMPFLVIGTALLAQAVDGNATLGNASLSYTQGIWAGIMIPLGLAISLFVVGRFLAAPLNRMNLLTLPEFFFHRYDKYTEALVSFLTIVCFTVVIAGNLSAVAWILSVVSGIDYVPALIIATAVIVTYTIAGGLYSAIWTDFFQIHVALIGFVAAAAWFIGTHGWSSIVAAIPAEKLDLSGITKVGSGALTNWAGMIALAFGNAMALDFMERVFAAKSPETAKNACYYAGGLTIVIGACATILGLGAISLVQGVQDPRMVLPLFGINQLPYWMGVMVFVGILGASMSTANGAMLVISVVLSRNVFERWSSKKHEDSFMLTLSRTMALPTAAVAALVAWLRPEPGILLVVAFDIVFAGCVVPLFMGVHWEKANSAGAIASIAVGTFARLIAHIVTPAEWAGLDTLIPPVLSLVTFYSVCSLTWKSVPARHYALHQPRTETLLADAADA